MIMGYGMGGMFFPGFGIVIQIVLFVFFLGIVYWVVKYGKSNNDDPETILKKRLAKGEITKKEYKEILNELEK